MTQYILEEPANDSNFDETAYLRANLDVSNALQKKWFSSGFEHFKQYGKKEGRKLRRDTSIILDEKNKKLDRIKSFLRDDMSYVRDEYCYNFLTKELRQQFDIVDTNAVSSNSYDGRALRLIEKYENGIILDCGAGSRSVYYDNVVNFEIVPYETTDVCGVGEKLPFKDNSFECVLSLAVLEHVKDPFQCAKEIVRVLRPGGDLMCCVPFLQPYHGYPHHYYNMTHQGLRNLFNESLFIDSVEVQEYILPIYSLTWILKSWSEGLQGKTKEEFLNLRVSDLIQPARSYLNRSFVKDLSEEKNFELVAGNVIFAHKPDKI